MRIMHDELGEAGAAGEVMSYGPGSAMNVRMNASDRRRSTSLYAPNETDRTSYSIESNLVKRSGQQPLCAVVAIIVAMVGVRLRSI